MLGPKAVGNSRGGGQGKLLTVEIITVFVKMRGTAAETLSPHPSAIILYDHACKSLLLFQSRHCVLSLSLSHDEIITHCNRLNVCMQIVALN